MNTIYICSKLNIIGLDNGLSPGWHQAIIGTSAGILFIWSLGTHLNKILILKSAFENVFCEVVTIFLGLNVLNHFTIDQNALLSLKSECRMA